MQHFNKRNKISCKAEQNLQPTVQHDKGYCFKTAQKFIHKVTVFQSLDLDCNKIQISVL